MEKTDYNKKDYNNFVKSMNLSHHWYCAGEELGDELRYGLFEPSNELVMEFMEENGYPYLADLIKGCEYTKNIDLLYLVTEFVLAKWKNSKRKPEAFSQQEEIEDCLYEALKTMYRLVIEGTIYYGDGKIARIIIDYKENVDIEKCEPILDILLKKYCGYNIELSEASQKIINLEEYRQNRIQKMKNKYAGRYIDSYDALYNIIKFLTTALKEGMISIEANGTVKSPFFEEDSDFRIERAERDIIFKLDEQARAYIIKEGIDEGKIIVIEGMDFLRPEKPDVKKL